MIRRRARAALLALALALAATPAPAASLARLADAFAAEVARAAAGEPVEFALPVDRTGAGLAADLQTLLEARLRDRTPLGPGGLLVEPVLAYEGPRLVLSARVTRDGALVDVLSVSVERDGALLGLTRLRPGPGGPSLDVVSSELSAPLGHRAVAVAWLDAERLVALAPSEIVLYRRDAAGLRRIDQAALPATARVRHPGGRLAVHGTTVDAWSSTAPAGFRFQVAADRLDPGGEPGDDGVRFRAGTNLLDGEVGGANGPFVAVADTAVVDATGRLTAWQDGRPRSGVRVGSAVARLWDDVLVASSPSPPDGSDELLIVDANGTLSIADRIPVPGDVRALAAQVDGTRATLAAAIETSLGVQLLLVELSRPVLETRSLR